MISENKPINESTDTSKSKDLKLRYKELKSYISKFSGYIIKIVDKIVPTFAPLLEINEKLIPDEEVKDNVLIRHYSEIQILIGLIAFFVGLFTLSYDSLLIFLCVIGFLLVFTGFEIEEIYVTSKRLFVRHIGFLERIIRVPSDEEHLLNHVVSYSIGRAPFNLFLVGLSLVGPIIVIIRESNPNYSSYAILTLFIFIMSLSILIIGMRLGKRVIVLNLAGNHSVLLGVRKGVPVHILKSIISVVFNQPVSLDQNSAK